MHFGFVSGWVWGSRRDRPFCCPDGCEVEARLGGPVVDSERGRLDGCGRCCPRHLLAVQHRQHGSVWRRCWENSEVGRLRLRGCYLVRRIRRCRWSYRWRYRRSQGCRRTQSRRWSYCLLLRFLVLWLVLPVVVCFRSFRRQMLHCYRLYGRMNHHCRSNPRHRRRFEIHQHRYTLLQ